MMTIDRRSLNFVMEIPREGAANVLVHSEAMPHGVFEQYFDLCGPAYNALLTGGYGATAPRYAAMMFRRIAQSILGPEPAVPNDAWNRAKAASEARVAAFFAELHRLTYVLTLSQRRWEMVLLEDAIRMGVVDDEEVSRIDGGLCFFTVASQSVPREIREAMLGGLSLYGARIESSSCTEFARSLPTSMTDGSSGENPDSSPVSSSGSPERGSSLSSAATTPPTGVPLRSGIVLSSVRRAG